MKPPLQSRTNSTICHIMYLLCGLLCLLMLVYIGMSRQEEIHQYEMDDTYESLPFETYTRVENPSTALGFHEEYQWGLSSPDEKNTFLIFYTIHHYTDVYVNGELALRLDENKSNRIYHGISGKWIYVPLHLSNTKTDVRVVSEPIYRNVIHRQPEFYLGDPVALFRAVRTDDMGNICLSILGLLFGFCLLVFWVGVYIYKKQNAHYMRYLGILLLLLSFCKLSGMRSSSIIFSVSSTLFGYLSNFALVMAWMTFDRFIDHRYSDYTNKWFVSLRLCTFTGVLVMLLLQFFGLYELRNAMYIIYAGVVVDLFAVGIVAFHQMKANPKLHTKLDFAFGMLLTLSVFTDILRLYIQGVSRSLFFTFLAFLVYVVYIFASYLHNLQTDVWHDKLTGLLNRRFWEQLATHIDDENTPYGLLMIDMNNLKITNDESGHSAGDKLLIQFSAILEKAMPDTCDVFRIGGDEFLAYIPDADRPTISSAIQKLNDYVLANNQKTEIYISYALGAVFSADHPGKNATELLNIADRKMYENKTAQNKNAPLPTN